MRTSELASLQYMKGSCFKTWSFFSLFKFKFRQIRGADSVDIGSTYVLIQEIF